MAFEEIEVPLGTFISWGTREGQHVTGYVVDYDETGGTDFNKNSCPLLEVELTERASSFTKQGERSYVEPGERALLTIGQVRLRKQIKEAQLKRGDLIKITLKGEQAVSGGQMKVFSLQVDRSANRGDAFHSSGNNPAADGFGSPADDQPPF